MKRVCLVTLPHAGGSSLLFKGWGKTINCRLINIEYPGHWKRIREPLLSSFDELAQEVSQDILNELNAETDIVLLGHSLGAILAWYLTEIIEQCGINVKGLFLLGSQNPGAFPETGILNAHTDDEILELIDYSVDDTADIKNKYFRMNILPVIRSDLEICKSFKKKEIRKDIDSFVFYGIDDLYTNYNEIVKWKDYVDIKSIIGLRGKHLFLTEKGNRAFIISTINNFIDML